MKRPRILVDFNEMLEPDLVLLSPSHTRIDSSGTTILLSEGLNVSIYEEDVDAHGRPDNLIADGVVEKNTSVAIWASQAIWCCRVGVQGIRHESDD